MHRLSALALGPLLARAAPTTGSGAIDLAAFISEWLRKRLADPSGRFATALTRCTDRAWRSLEIALAGEELHRFAIVSGVDRALVEQIRQFIAVAPVPKLKEEFCKRVRQDLQGARRAGLIPGQLPSANALAALTIRFLAGVREESPEADSLELDALALELRAAEFPSLAKFIELHTSNQPPLLVTAMRYFFSREINSDLLLMRDLRAARVELADSLRSGLDRLADAFDRFTTTIAALLAELTASLEKVAEVPESAPPAVSPPIEQGFAIHGQNLLSPIRSDASGRNASCPVCLANVVLQETAGSWVSLRCESCGTEYEATDGSIPPPLHPVAGAGPSELKPRSPLAKNLEMWIDSGAAARWIEYHKAVWSDLEFKRLTDILEVSHYWPLDLIEVRKVLIDLTTLFRTKGPGWSVLPSRPYSPPKKMVHKREAVHTELIHTSESYWRIDGSRWVPCPLCRSFNVEIPPLASGEMKLACSGCGKSFIVDLKKVLVPGLPPPLPTSSPTPSFWGKVRKWLKG